jgi:hypothetical protein
VVLVGKIAQTDDGVFLYVELSRPKIPSEAKGVELVIWHDEIPTQADGIGDELDHEGGNIDGRVPQLEEHVNAASNGGQNQANDPCTNSVARQVLVIISHGCAHLIWC